MSEAEKPEEVQVTTAANGTGPPEDSGGEVVAEKTDEMENGVKTEVEHEKATHEKKHEDVKMVDAANVKVEDENVEGSRVEKAEPTKVEGEEKEREELKGGQEAEEKSDMAKEKDEEADEQMKDAKVKNGVAKGKSEEGHEKDEKFEEKVEEAKERGDVTKGESVEGDEEKESETEEKGEEAEEKSDEAEEKSEEYNEDKTEENEEDKGTRKKRGRGRKVVEKVEGKQKRRRGKNKDVLRTPTTSSIDRPVRERKTVERLVEIVEKEQDKGFLIEKGQGTPLKDIPNVAYKLSKRKPADIRSLHLLLFGRKGKAINYKSHIFQFSGFVWHENEDKQRAKLKEKLDKCVKDRLLDFCDVFDIQVSRAAARKEDLVAKLLDFMVAPHPTTDVVLAEKEQSRKRKRVSRKSALKRFVGISGRQSRKKRTKREKTKSAKHVIETEDEEEEEEENEENGLPDEDEPIKHSESEEEDEYEYDNAEKEDEYSGKDKQDTKKSSKKRGSPATPKSKKVTTPRRAPLPASTKSPNKPHSKRFKTDEAKDPNEEVFSRKKKNAVTPKKTPSSNSAMKDKKTIGKKAGRRKAKSDRAEESGPTEEELREKISEILKEVDFNTATFTDILKKLASHYNVDLTARKASIKLMIQDELTKLADEADEDEDDDGEDDEGEGDADKVEDSEPGTASKEVEA